MGKGNRVGVPSVGPTVTQGVAQFLSASFAVSSVKQG